jgi:hypothetical protein
MHRRPKKLDQTFLDRGLSSFHILPLSPASFLSLLTLARPSPYSKLLGEDQMPDYWKTPPTFYRSLLTKLQNLLGFPEQHLPPAPPNDEAEIKAIAGLIRQLKSQSEALIGMPINYTMLSLPSFFNSLTRTDTAQFVEAQRRTGIGRLRNYLALNAASAIQFFYDINTCKDAPDPNWCDEEFVYVIISYEKAALTMSLNSATTTMPDMGRWKTFVDLGANCDLRREAPEKYWESVRSNLEKFVGSEALKSLSGLYLHGESATDPEFLKVLREVFGSNDALKEEDYIKAPREHLFAAANGAAKSARVGMETGYMSCIIPEHCPRPRDEVVNGDGLPVDDSRSEL